MKKLIALLCLLLPLTVVFADFEERITFPLPDDDEPFLLSIDSQISIIEVRSRPDAEEIEVDFEVIGWDDDEISLTAEEFEGGLSLSVDVRSNVIETYDIEDADTTVLLEVVIPENINLEITNSVGLVVLENIRVQESLVVTTDVAAVEFEGNIDGGVYDITTDVGNITVDADITRDALLTITTDVGAIVFDGQVRDEAFVSLVSGVGEITVEVEPDSEFELIALVEFGEIDYDLRLRDEVFVDDMLEKTLTGIVGRNADDVGATLSVNSELGDVVIEEARRGDDD